MIKINLLGDSTKIDRSGHMIIAGYLSSIVIALGIFYLLSSSLSYEIEDLESQTQTLQADLTRVQKVTREVKDLEQKKAEYNSKLLVIATLKKSKAGPVRVLDDLNIALPEKAWLTDVKERDGGLQIVGRTLDNQTVASFMRELQKSEYFGEAQNQVIKKVEQDGVKMMEFSFYSKIFYAGKEAAQAAQAAAEAQQNAEKAANKG